MPALDSWHLRGSFRYLRPSMFLIFDANGITTEALHPASKLPTEDAIPSIQKNFDGWVNPEDLTPMPQCIAQQDQSTWLNTMTKCTHKRCTSHFAFICTHQQWLTQLTCLSAEFSPNVIKEYIAYCSRSVLGKAQLYNWVHSATGRTWLVDVGDANELQNLSPASLSQGYANFDITHNAPTCLTSSLSAASMEPFDHVMGSCSFTSATQRTGYPDRPWEYSESLRSMVSLGFETVGYNLTGGHIGYDDSFDLYFDKACFCKSFTTVPGQEPCSEPSQTGLQVTRERLWMNATCGPTSLHGNWTDKLKTMGFAYIPMEDWHWPTCVTDMPKQVTELHDQCATDACELDSDGYCKVKRAIDRTCFCHDITYDSCRGSCHIFDTRIDYVKWLHDLCGNVQDWKGLPDNWRQLATPTRLEMIPWRWTLKASNNSNVASITRLGSIKTTQNCASNETKVGSFALINLATFLAVLLSHGKGVHQIARDSESHTHPSSWFFTGILIATLQLVANFLNAFLVQKTLGYEHVPVAQLMLLWCSMPRFAWPTIWLVGVRPFGEINLSAAASSLFAEVILQLLSSYYMFLTVDYGREHNFYRGGLEGAERGQSALIMYAGALMWLIIFGMALFKSIQAIYRPNKLTGPDRADLPKWERSKQTESNVAERLMTQCGEYWTCLEEKLADYLIDESRASREPLLAGSDGRTYTVYGTLAVPVESTGNWVLRQRFQKLCMIAAISIPLFWVAQWLFWSGFIGLSSEE